MNAYEILGIQPGATEEEVIAAYKAKAQAYRPELFDDEAGQAAAEAMTNQLNDAFDTVMGELRTGNGGSNTGGPYWQIRAKLNGGDAEGALQDLNAMSAGDANAEWNFLTGSAYYAKGWLNDAMRYFETACQLEPGNREYEAALRNLQGHASGNMNGNPYAQNGYTSNTSGMACSCCDVCTTLMCMDMCCSCGNGCC